MGIEHFIVMIETRNEMKNYWIEHSTNASIQEMFLDDTAEILDRLDKEEVLKVLPCLNGKDIVEIGAGIGRLTQYIAPLCKSLKAVDFMEKFIRKNEETNGRFSNVSFECNDVTKMIEKPFSYDFVFTNWLLMYLNDTECKEFAQKSLKWLKLGGFIFIRESCFHQSGNKQRSFNPSFYRSTDYYFDLFNETNDDKYSYQLIKHGNMKCYEELKRNKNQSFWLFQKVETKSKPHDLDLQSFLDNQQYAIDGILKYERIFGHGFVSTGGIATTTEFLQKLNLLPNQIVLDVGCGIGGGDFLMAKEYGVIVNGIDLSTNMINLALQRAKEYDNLNVIFSVANVLEIEYEENSFDLIYSRDAILHIENKKELFERFYKWLKPGGQVFITDYCCGDGKHSDEFNEYVKQRNYHLLTPNQYGKVLESVGFNIISAIDNTQQFVEVLKNEKQRFDKEKDEFVSDYGEDAYNHIVDGWNRKLVRCDAGDQKWGLFHVKKP